MGEKKIFGDYYLGLDIGTDSVGWAVTDPQYNILEFNRKAMWGIHLFEAGETAEDRRLHRCSRRRLQRRHQRIMLLRELLDQEISKKDPMFYARLDESNWVIEDRKSKQKNSLFNDPNFTDKEYMKKYPTIYHLRRDMRVTDQKPDIRLVYLAIHHILKYRGHFLFEGLSDNSDMPEFEEVFGRLLEMLSSECGIDFGVSETIPEIKETLLSKMSITGKTGRLCELMSATTVQEKSICKLLAGGKEKPFKIFDDEAYKDLDSVEFKGSSFEDSRDELLDALGDGNFAILDCMKQIYDWSILKTMLKGHGFISDAMIDKYETHKHDLATLKAIFKELSLKNGGDKTLYDEMFKAQIKGNYTSYSKMIKGPVPDKLWCTQEEFCKHVYSILQT